MHYLLFKSKSPNLTIVAARFKILLGLWWVEHMPPCRDRRIAERVAATDTMFKPFGHCRCSAEILYRRLGTPTVAVVQKNLTEVHYVSENGYTVLTTPGRARERPADLRLLTQSPIEPTFVPTIIWKRDDLGLHINTPNEHRRPLQDARSSRASSRSLHVATPMSKIDLNLTRPLTAMSTIVDPVATSVAAPRAHTSHSLSRAARRATEHTSSYGRLLSAPMPSRPVCRLEPLELVHLQLRHSLSRASLLSSGTSRLSLSHVPSTAVLDGIDRPQTHHQGSRLASRSPSSTLHPGRRRCRRRPWDPPNCSIYLHTGPLRDKEFYLSPEERAAIRRAEDAKRAALAAVKEAHLAATKVQAVHRGRLSRQEYPAQAHGRTSALAASILHKVTLPARGDGAHEAARRAAEVGAMVGAPAAASSAKATDGLSSLLSSQIVDQLKLILSRDRKRVIDLFRSWDTDGDHRISKAEIGRAFIELGIEIPDNVLNEVFRALDLRSTGKVFAEVDALFAALDLDGSGQIEFAEMNEALSRSGKGHF